LVIGGSFICCFAFDWRGDLGAFGSVCW